MRLHDPDGAALPDPRREDPGRHPRGADDTRPRRDGDRAHRPAAPRRTRPAPKRTSCQNTRGGRIDRSASAPSSRCGRAREQPPPARGLPPLPNTTPHTLAAHLHLDRPARQQLRRQVGHEPGRPRRLEDDDGRLRPARAARPAKPRKSFDRSCAPRGSSWKAAPNPQPPSSLGHHWATRRKSARSRRSGTSTEGRKTTRFQGYPHGETQTRTGDTTIFSRVLYQLSYLALILPDRDPDATGVTHRPRLPQSARMGAPAGLPALEFLDQRLVGHPQALRDRHLGRQPSSRSAREMSRRLC